MDQMSFEGLSSEEAEVRRRRVEEADEEAEVGTRALGLGVGAVLVRGPDTRW